jgi:predicted nucleotidyltransferase
MAKWAMDRSEIIRRLQAHRQHLLAMGVARVSLFGSMARGDGDQNSDIDLAVRLDRGFSNGGFDYFARMEALREELTEILGRSVDLVEEPVRTSRLQSAIEKDRVIAVQ